MSNKNPKVEVEIFLGPHIRPGEGQKLSGAKAQQGRKTQVSSVIGVPAKPPTQFLIQNFDLNADRQQGQLQCLERVNTG